jgi:GST-like protein
MFGQRMHFSVFSPQTIPYGIKRYEEQGEIVNGLVDHLLADQNHFLGDEFSIVDIAFYSWFAAASAAGFPIEHHRNLIAWFERVGARPAVIRGMTVPTPLPNFPPRKRL